jgi:AraC-like DNA-binding protein
LHRSGDRAQLVEVACRAGRHDKPYAEEHSGWTIALLRRGAFSYRAADTNRVHPLRPGWLLLGRPGCGFECSHEHDGGDDCASLNLSEGIVDEVARHTRGCRGPIFPAPVLGPSPRVSALLHRLAAGITDLDESAYEIAAEVIARGHDARPAEVDVSPAHRARIDAAIALIDERASDALSLADLAGAAGLSQFYFLRLFRKVTGTTPHQYLVGARLGRAASLLVDTKRPVTDIAYEAGFEDLSNFVRTFHRVVGRSPRAYRSSGLPRSASARR